MQEEFEAMARHWNGDVFGIEPSAASSVTIDLEDKDEELVLTAELPGFDEDDIDIRVTDRTLRIEAEHEEKEEEEEEEEGKYIRRERRHASAVRSIPLPEAVEADEISATYNNGILTIRMPKSEPVAQGTQIEIE
ncbi:Hsp20/alpha crystallin family protein [Halopenitus sp. H-Gu1]|uniref:Hsp20/alpha crystallin family protein n=1 Tax=Halopenitus sp. H-Gu1 TaxID=3242697 RepID=UPI00359FFDA6